MKNYHLFNINNKNFVFFSEYKQAFELSEEESDLFKNNDLKIIEEYSSSLDESELIQEESTELSSENDYIYGLYLCISNACNARCVYCFAHQGNYGKKDILMDEETAYKAIDFFMDQVPETSCATIIFFGGEPLLAFDIIKKTCKYVETNYSHRQYMYTITTNGTLLNEENIQFMIEHNFRIGLSIDGGSEIQNFQRPLANGKDSFLEATKTIPTFINEYKKVVARGTYYTAGCDLSQCYSDVIDLGIPEVNIVPDFLDMTDEKMKDLLKQMDKWYLYICEYIHSHDDFPFTSLIIRIRKLFTSGIDNQYSCGLGKIIFSVDAFGDIYPCHRFGDVESSKIGTINEGLNKEFIINRKTNCDSCWNKNTCNHGCTYEDYQNEKKIHYFCQYSQRLTEIAIAVCSELDYDKLVKIIKIPRSETITSDTIL